METPQALIIVGLMFALISQGVYHCSSDETVKEYSTNAFAFGLACVIVGCLVGIFT